MNWKSVEFDEERLALVQMRICPAISMEDNREEEEEEEVLSREEQLDRHYWGFQKLLNLLPPNNNCLSLGPQMNNDLEVHEEVQKAVRVRLECLERLIKLLRELREVEGNVKDTLGLLAEERERLKGWNALVYLAKIDLEAGPALNELSEKYMQMLKQYSVQMKENIVEANIVEAKVRLDTDLEIIQTIKLLQRFERVDAIIPYLELRQRMYEMLGVSKELAKEEERERLTQLFGENEYLNKYLQKF